MDDSHIANVTSSDLAWPIVSLDFEASGLSQGTYPIEVGVAWWTAPDQGINVWSTLIQPAPEWTAHGVWSAESQKIHRIPRASLEDGLSVRAVMHHLTAIIGVGGMALTDNFHHDAYWLTRLATAANASQSFALAPWSMLHQALSLTQAQRMWAYSSQTPPPHRAGPDAEINIRLLGAALGFDQSSIPTSNLGASDLPCRLAPLD